MNILDIYHQYPIALIKGKGLQLEDDQGNHFIDFYGGHGVISIGHGHPEFVGALTSQLNQLAFYSNAFVNPLQSQLAELLGELSGYRDYQLFLSNSGAEANENALKVASFVTKRQKVLAVKGAFHGRSAGAVAVTDNPSIRAAFGQNLEVDFVEIDNIQKMTEAIGKKQYAAFIIEGIQGVNGVWEASSEYWKMARLLCTQTGTVLIADEVQSGYGRSGKFFAHQFQNVFADIITVGKGMGNGFPVAGTLINPTLKLEKGKLGTTFGGGQLACAAAISVLQVMKKENLMQNASEQGTYLIQELQQTEGVKTVRGKGLMLGIEFVDSGKEIRDKLLKEQGIVTGFSSPDVVRILPPLMVSHQDAGRFLNALKSILKTHKGTIIAKADLAN